MSCSALESILVKLIPQRTSSYKLVTWSARFSDLSSWIELVDGRWVSSALHAVASSYSLWAHSPSVSYPILQPHQSIEADSQNSVWWLDQQSRELCRGSSNLHVSRKLQFWDDEPYYPPLPTRSPQLLHESNWNGDIHRWEFFYDVRPFDCYCFNSGPC